MERQFFDVATGEQINTLPDSAWILGDGSAPSYLTGPAFFDPQVNGYAGVDFQSPNLSLEQLEFSMNAIRRAGCSHVLLTLLTAGVEFLQDQLALLSDRINESSLLQEMILGFHIEGPFLSTQPGFFGAHPQEHLREPDWNEFERLQRRSRSSIRMVTLAPELPGSLEFIEKASAGNVFVCLGHTDASYQQLVAAVEAGARMFTHLGNGSPQRLPRHDNIIQRVLAIPELMASLIPDGIHLPPFVLSNLAHALGTGRLVMTTDCMSAAGAGCGTYTIGQLEVTVGADGIVRLPDGGGFAGSSLRMIDGFYNCIRFGGLGSQAAWHGWTRLRKIMFPRIQAPWLAVPFPTANGK